MSNFLKKLENFPDFTMVIRKQKSEFVCTIEPLSSEVKDEAAKNIEPLVLRWNFEKDLVLDDYFFQITEEKIKKAGNIIANMKSFEESLDKAEKEKKEAKEKKEKEKSQKEKIQQKEKEISEKIESKDPNKKEEIQAEIQKLKKENPEADFKKLDEKFNNSFNVSTLFS